MFEFSTKHSGRSRLSFGSVALSLARKRGRQPGTSGGAEMGRAPIVQLLISKTGHAGARASPGGRKSSGPHCRPDAAKVDASLNFPRAPRWRSQQPFKQDALSAPKWSAHVRTARSFFSEYQTRQSQVHKTRHSADSNAVWIERLGFSGLGQDDAATRRVDARARAQLARVAPHRPKEERQEYCPRSIKQHVWRHPSHASACQEPSAAVAQKNTGSSSTNTPEGAVSMMEC